MSNNPINHKPELNKKIAQLFQSGDEASIDLGFQIIKGLGISEAMYPILQNTY